MLRFVMRMLAPPRLRRAVRSRVDARYVTRNDHRRDIKDALWEVQMLRREIVALRREVERLRDVPRTGVAKSDPRAADAHRLAYETAEALDRVLHNEVLVWQAIDGLKAEVARVAARAEPVTSGAIVNAE